MGFGSALLAQECGNFCELDWWKTVTVADVQADLKAGANPNAQHEFGHTPLHGAARGGTLALLRTLLDAGADPNLADNYVNTALHWAASFGISANIQALVDAGADASSQSDSGKTPWELTRENHQIKDSTAYLTLKNAHFSK